MKAEHTEHLPFIYTSDTRTAASSPWTGNGKHLTSWENILRRHKNNSSVQFFESILERASSMSASHIYFEPEETVLRVRYRMSNQLTEEVLPTDEKTFNINELLVALFGDNNTNISFEAHSSLTARLGKTNYNLTLMPLRTISGLALTVGLKKSLQFAPTLDELEIPHFTLKQLRDLLRNRSGLVLITGPNASGKENTRMAVLQELNSPSKKIISIEHSPTLQLPRVSHIPTHSGIRSNESFAKYLLQQAPDVCSSDDVLNGELFIPLLNSTVNNTLLIANTHASSAIEAIESLSALGCNRHVLAKSLLGIMTQREIPNVCPSCKSIHHLNAIDRKWIQQNFPGEDINDGRFTLGEGCEECAQTGYSGSSKVYELIQNDEELCSAIIAGDKSSLVTAISLRSNFQTLKEKAFILANRGTIPLEQVMLLA